MSTMNKEEEVTFQNPSSSRPAIYGLVTTVICAIAIFLVTYVLGKNLVISVILSLTPFSLVILWHIGGLRNPIEVKIGAQGIESVNRKGLGENVPWDRVVSLKPVPLDPGFFVFMFLKENGKKSYYVLSQEPAEYVRKKWSALHLNGEDLTSKS